MMLLIAVITPAEVIDAIVVAPYLNNSLPPDSSIVKLVVNSFGVLVAVAALIAQLPDALLPVLDGTSRFV